MREIVLLRFGKSRLRGEAHHATDGHFLRDLDGDDVEAVRERISDGDGLVRILLAEVAGRVLLIAEGESLRLVHVSGRGGNDARHRIVGGVERRRVDEGLEDGAGLSHRVGRAVELTLLVITTADHRDYLARVGLQRDERGLKRAGREASGLNLVERGELFDDRRVGRALQVHVNGRVDAQTVGG